MKNASMSLMVIALLGAAVCSPPAPPTYASPEKTNAQLKRELVEKLESETVALVRSDEKDSFSPYCSGVWVDVDKIMTAFHCVKEESLENGMLNVFLYQVIDDNIKSGRASQVNKVDEENDLALLVTDLKTTPMHPIAEIADDSWDGEHVNIVGHTNGMWWTYIEGVVSSTRADAVKSNNKPTLVLQISAPAWFGNSGGGAFDDSGKLLGISSFISSRAPSMAFFVHRAVLKKLMLKK
jgi:S1-C subfamily serine protease